MKKLWIVAFISMVFCACGGADNTSSNTKTDDDSKTVTEEQPIQEKLVSGKRVYKIYCFTCHGPNGNMGGSGALDLTISKLSLKESIQVIKLGRNNMTPYEGILEEAEILAVAKYIQTFKKEVTE